MILGRNMWWKQLTALREEKDWSVEKLAYRSKISPKIIRRLEEGDESINVSILGKVVNALGYELKIGFTEKD